MSAWTSIRKTLRLEANHSLVQVRNFGQTPAYDVYHSFQSIVAPLGCEQFPVEEKVRPRTAIVNPSDSFTVRSSCSEMLLPDKVDAIMADTKKIYFFGEIRYRDAFGEARTTSVRHENLRRGPDEGGPLRDFRRRQQRNLERTKVQAASAGKMKGWRRPASSPSTRCRTSRTICCRQARWRRKASDVARQYFADDRDLAG